MLVQSKGACRARFLFSLTVMFALAEFTFAAGARTQNFIVTARDPQFARQVAEMAERYRADLATEWLGDVLPPWREPCPIEVREAPGAGGATSFMFEHGRPFGWTMSIQGSRQRILDSVLPHEVTHTIFATHFGRPVPRWADEGACTTVEHPGERAKQQQFLIEFLSTGRGIPFNSMFRMTEYPHDIMPLYSQGHSVAQFLISQGGKRRFVNFVGYGMDRNNWDEAIHQFYGFQDLSDLQLTWVDWVKSGSPALPAQERSVAAAENGNSAGSQSSIPAKLASQTSPPPFQLASQTNTASWYAQQRSKARHGAEERVATNSGAQPRQSARAQPPQQIQEQVLEWDDSYAIARAPTRGVPAMPPGYVPKSLPMVRNPATNYRR